jgi:Restriction endonuclease S subunits
MSNNNKTPAIRFKGFTDDWEQRLIGEWGSFYYGHSCPKWSVTEEATTPCIRYGEMYTKFGCKIDRVYSYTSIPKENLKFSKGTEVLVPRVGEDPMDYNHCTWLSLANVAIGEMISVYNTKQNPLFTAIMFNATLKYEFAKRVEGGSVTNLYYEKLLEIPVSFPNIAEQQRIASLFENIDTLITFHQRKCVKLIQFKAAMLQKMFPQNGADKPEIRFKGFTDAWEQRKLENITSLITKGTTPKDKSGDGEVNFIKVENIDPSSGEITSCSRISLEEHDGYLKRSQLKENDILFSIAGTLGRTSVVNKGILPANTNQALAILRMSEGDISYLVTVLRGRAVSDFIKKNPTVGAQPNLSLEQVSNLEIPYPKLEEQKKIGAYFSHLDSLITLHQRKCEKYKSIKAGVIRKLFP